MFVHRSIQLRLTHRQRILSSLLGDADDDADSRGAERLQFLLKVSLRSPEVGESAGSDSNR